MWRLNRVCSYGYDSLAYEMRVQKTCITFHNGALWLYTQRG